MSDVTQLIDAIDQGDPQAASRLLPLVYDELRRLAAQKLAQEKAGQMAYFLGGTGCGGDSRVIGGLCPKP